MRPSVPADLNRAEMVLFNKLKVENSVADYQLSLQARTTTFPSGMSLDGLAQQLTLLELFAGANAQALRRLILKSTLRLLVPGEELCQEGEFHERLCVVLDGSLEQTSRGPRGERIHILVIGPGTFFGEMGVLADAAEPFGVTARERSIVLEAPKVAVLALMELCPISATRCSRCTRGGRCSATPSSRAAWARCPKPRWKSCSRAPSSCSCPRARCCSTSAKRRATSTWCVTAFCARGATPLPGRSC